MQITATTNLSIGLQHPF